MTAGREAAIWDLLGPENCELGFDDPRVIAAFEACQLAMEHGQALRGLISAQFDSTAAAALRNQFEALTRAHWALYAATDEDVELLFAPLSEAFEKAASGLLMAAAMSKIAKPFEACLPLLLRRPAGNESLSECASS